MITLLCLVLFRFWLILVMNLYVIIFRPSHVIDIHYWHLGLPMLALIPLTIECIYNACWLIWLWNVEDNCTSIIHCRRVWLGLLMQNCCSEFRDVFSVDFCLLSWHAFCYYSQHFLLFSCLTNKLIYHWYSRLMIGSRYRRCKFLQILTTLSILIGELCHCLDDFLRLSQFSEYFI